MNGVRRTTMTPYAEMYNALSARHAGRPSLSSAASTARSPLLALLLGNVRRRLRGPPILPRQCRTRHLDGDRYDPAASASSSPSPFALPLLHGLVRHRSRQRRNRVRPRPIGLFAAGTFRGPEPPPPAHPAPAPTSPASQWSARNECNGVTRAEKDAALSSKGATLYGERFQYQDSPSIPARHRATSSRM